MIGLLLIDIFAAFEKRPSGRIFSRDLAAELNGYGNRPWAEGIKGRRIDEYWLANQLRPYGVRPKTLWIEGVIAKGYAREDMEEVFGRYITKADMEEAKERITKHQAPSTKEEPSSNHQIAVPSETQAPDDSVREETAIAAQTKARKEDWRRIAGI